MYRRAVLGLLIFGLLLTLLSVDIGKADSPMDYDVPNGHFYQQANGQGGAGNTGFAVTNDDGVEFWTWFNRFGGVDVVGYPVSHRFQWKGFTAQAFQKVTFQWRPESRTVMFVNIFDELTAAGKDDWLLTTQMVPKPFDWSGDAGKPWDQVVANHLSVLNQYPALQAAYFSTGDPVIENGLPMAVQDFGNAIVVRAQRKVFQEWKVDVPWAKAGQVTVANGGDTGKMAGLYPQDAITPRPWGATPCPAPSFSGFTASPSTVNAGQRVLLSWGPVSNATSVSIDNGIGSVGTPGSREVFPTSTTTYVMTATGPCGTAQIKVTVNVNTPPPPPQPVPSVQQVSPPSGYVETRTPTVTLTWNSVSSPGSPNYVYNVEVEKGLGNFWAPYANPRGISGTSYTLSDLGDDFRGHWRVWAVDPTTGAEGPKSSWWDFSVSLLPQ